MIGQTTDGRRGDAAGRPGFEVEARGARVRRAGRPGARAPTRPAATWSPRAPWSRSFYSDGPEQVPDVVGPAAGRRPRGDPRRRLRARRGRGPDTDRAEGHGHPAEPARPARTPPEGSTVTIVVSAFEEPTETPSPTEPPTGDARPTPPDETIAADRVAGRPAPLPPGRGSAQRLGVAEVEQAVVRRRGDGVLELEVPADRDVGVVGLRRGRARGSRRPRSRRAARAWSPTA